MKRWLSILLASILIVSNLSVAFAATGTPSGGVEVENVLVDPGTVLAAFDNPHYSDRPMARMWLADASAALDDYNTIEKQIFELAEKGWGGVEVTMLANSSKMTNEEAKIVGWGTPAWRDTLKLILKAANSVQEQGIADGFVVDITITAHWPVIINNIDPNDIGASQETAYTTQKVGPSLNAIDLSLPSMKIQDSSSAPFIFVDTLDSAVLVKVASVSGGRATYELASPIDVTDLVTTAGGYAAGVPDEAAIAQYYGSTSHTYDSVLNLFGDEPAADADFSQSYNGKVDEDGNRKRMADWQDYYKVDLSDVSALSGYVPSSGDDLAMGDYVLVNVYRRGTGQVLSTGVDPSFPMYGRPYCTDYFSVEGVTPVTQFWAENILDEEMIELLMENAESGVSSIFEDSIEASKSTNFWSSSILQRLEDDGYQYAVQMPMVVVLGSSSFDDTSLAGRIQTDYNNLLGVLYEDEHLSPIKEWASNTFNYKYRAQVTGITGLDKTTANTVVDIAEGDNGTKGDGVRQLLGTAALADIDYVSMEAVTGMDGHRMNWADIVTELNQNFSDGINHMVLHGTPYSKSFNGYYANWPGWIQFDNAHEGAYTYRQTYWDEVSTITDHMARIQSVFVKGQPKLDLAYIYSSGSGNSLQTLLDNGYSYGVFNPSIVDLPNAVVTDGRLHVNGPAYKAIIMGNISTITVSQVKKLQALASDGLPVILFNANPSSVPGTESGDNTDANMKAAFETLKNVDHVYSASSQDEIVSILKDLGLDADASYQQSALETTHYVDVEDGSDFYFLFNNTRPQNSGMVNKGQGASYKKDPVDTVVTLKGEGIPYTLDTWSGEIIPIAEYTNNGNGTISVHVALDGGDTAMIAILPEGVVQSERNEGVELYGVDNSGTLLYRDGKLYFRSNEAGDHAITLSDGSSKTVTVATEMQALDLSDAKWDLELISFGPDDSEENLQDPILPEHNRYGYQQYKDPSSTKYTTIYFEDIDLVKWEDLPTTDEQLAELGVDVIKNSLSEAEQAYPAMKFVSGIGNYTTTFTLPEGWDIEHTAAIVSWTYIQDTVTAITVNGQTFDRINNVSDKVDIGQALAEGENTITVKSVSPLFNRMRAESRIFDDNASSWVTKTMIENGLTGVALTPYTLIAVEDAVESPLRLTTEAHNIRQGDYLAVNASFKEEQNSNAVVLNYTFDGDKFEYVKYIPANGVGVVDTQFGAGFVKITLMISGYNAEELGDIELRAKEDAILYREKQGVSVAAEYVLRDTDGNKTIETASAGTSFTTLGNGTPEPVLEGDTNDDGIVDLIDLSNMIDWFGITSADVDWEDWYTYFDFNNNGEIDIYDICYVAQLIE